MLPKASRGEAGDRRLKTGRHRVVPSQEPVRMWARQPATEAHAISKRRPRLPSAALCADRLATTYERDTRPTHAKCDCGALIDLVWLTRAEAASVAQTRGG